MLAIRQRFWIFAIVLAFAAGCSTPMGSDADPDPDANLIVSGERIGDLASIGTAGSVIRAMPGGETVAISNPPSTLYVFRDEAGLILHTIAVCTSSDVVSTITIFNHPDNERFVTAAGLSVGSSESDVFAALGTPDRTRGFTNSRIHEYDEISDGSYGLAFSILLTDASSAHFIGVGGECQ